MLQVFLRYWCLMLLCSFMSTSAYYLPRIHTRVQSLQHISRALTEKHKEPPSSPVVKRYYSARMRSSTRMRKFRNYLQSARQRTYTNDQNFVQKTFRMFDMNADNRIEIEEFRAMLQFLHIVAIPPDDGLYSNNQYY